jgi:hypothetical protein
MRGPRSGGAHERHGNGATVTRDAGQIDGPKLALGAAITAAVLVGIVLFSGALVVQGTDVAPPPVELDCDRVASDDVIDVSSPVLLACPELFDGRTVTFAGEVVGSVMQRGQRAWLQVNDDAYARVLGPLPVSRVAAGSSSSVAVSVSRAAVERLLFVGGADAQGDRIRVVGVFRAAVLQVGGRYSRAASPRRVVAAVVCLAVAVLTSALVARSRRAERS